MVILTSICASLFAMLSVNQLRYWLTRNRRKVRERLKESLTAVPSTALAAGPLTGLAEGATAPKLGNRSAGSALTSRAEDTAAQKRRWLFRIRAPRGLGFPVVSVPASFLGSKFMERLAMELTRAGIPLRAEEMVGFSMILGFLGAVSGSLFIPAHRIAAAVLLGTAGFLLPKVWVCVAMGKRAARLETQLLGALMLMAGSLRAGHSFMQALELVSRELAPPLSVEFGKVVRETRMGIPVEEALTNMVKRVDSKDLELAVTGVLIQRQVGGNLAGLLDTISSTIEKRIKTRARIRVVTAQGRISAWIISVLPLCLAFLVFGMYPEFGGIMLSHPLGIAMLSGAALLLVVGIVVIRRVVSVNV